MLKRMVTGIFLAAAIAVCAALLPSVESPVALPTLSAQPDDLFDIVVFQNHKCVSTQDGKGEPAINGVAGNNCTCVPQNQVTCILSAAPGDGFKCVDTAGGSCNPSAK